MIEINIHIKVSGDTLAEIQHDLGGIAAAATEAAAEALSPVEVAVTGEQATASLSERATATVEPKAPAPKATKAKAEPKAKPKAVEAAPEPEPEEPKGLDYATDITPRVLEYMHKHGKTKVAELLAAFGVANARDINPARWPELLEVISEELKAA